MSVLLHTYTFAAVVISLFTYGNYQLCTNFASLKNFVQPNIKYWVDPSKTPVGSTATQAGTAGPTKAKMENTVSVVGEMDGKKIVELSGSSYKDYASGKPAAIAFLVDDTGKVHKAWGGLIGELAVELPVPEEKKVEGKGEKVDVKIEDLSPITHCDIKGEGKKYTTNGASCSTWKNSGFAFFGGVIQQQSKDFIMKLTRHDKSGAQALLKLK